LFEEKFVKIQKM